MNLVGTIFMHKGERLMSKHEDVGRSSLLCVDCKISDQNGWKAATGRRAHWVSGNHMGRGTVGDKI